MKDYGRYQRQGLPSSQVVDAQSTEQPARIIEETPNIHSDKVVQYIKSVLTIIKNEFWQDVLKALLKFQLLLNVDWDNSTIYQTPIFCNKNLTVGCKSFFYYSWFDKGICYIRDLLDDQGIFYEYTVFI